MTLIIDALAIADEQHLWGFMIDPEHIGNLLGDGPVVQKIQEVEIDAAGFHGPFQPALDEGAGGATGTMFEDELWAAGRSFPDLFQLRLVLQMDPVHVGNNTVK